MKKICLITIAILLSISSMGQTKSTSYGVKMFNNVHIIKGSDTVFIQQDGTWSSFWGTQPLYFADSVTMDSLIVREWLRVDSLNVTGTLVADTLLASWFEADTATIDTLSVTGIASIDSVSANYLTDGYIVIESGNIGTSRDTITLFSGAAGVDYMLQFDGEDNDGYIVYDEDADGFIFDNDISAAALYINAIQFGNGATIEGNTAADTLFFEETIFKLTGDVGINGPASTSLDVYVTSEAARIFGSPSSTQGLLHLRSSQTNDAYLSFAEDNVADRGGIGFDTASDTMKFIVGGSLSGGSVKFGIDDAELLAWDDLKFVDPGTDSNSYKMIFEADNSTTTQTGEIFVAYGANPYIRISPPNSSGAATPTIDIRSDLISLFNGEAGIDYYLSFNGETNDGTITYMEDEDRFDFDNDLRPGGSITWASGGEIQNDDADTLDISETVVKIDGELWAASNITMPHNTWFQSYNAAGGDLNVFKVDSFNNIRFGTTVDLRELYAPANADQNILNLPITSESDNGDTVRFKIWADSVAILQGGVVADGAGSFIDGSEFFLTEGSIYATPEHSDEASVTDDTSFDVPAGYILKYIVLEETAGNAATLDLGTTSGGSDLFINQTVTASTITTFVINKVFSTSATQTIYLNDDDASSDWNSASVDLYAVMEKVL